MKRFMGRIAPMAIKNIYTIYKNSRPLVRRECPICEYDGNFRPWGRPIRVDAKCPKCGSSERHRLLWLWFNKNSQELACPIVHFAAEKVLEFKIRNLGLDYFTADLHNEADIKINIEKIELSDESVGTVICNHVLEHVNDKLALAELFRVLKFGGKLIVSVPLVEGWIETYENPDIIEPSDRELHYGQFDHVRYYGRDFRHRLIQAGFKVQEITAEGPSVVKYSLLRGEKIFICHK